MDTPIWMTPRGGRRIELPLDVQSRGRPLTAIEQEFAEALEQLFSQGCHDFEELAAQLTEQNIVAPKSGNTKWSLETLNDEMCDINAQLDTAHQEQGYGA